MVQPFPRHSREILFSDQLLSVSVIGNVHSRRWRWNPFDIDHDLVRVDEHLWQRPLRLEAARGLDHSGHYAVRLVLNHNPRRQIKASGSSHSTGICCWNMDVDPFGNRYNNIRFKVHQDG